MTAFAIRRVTPTPEAEELIERLVERHGPSRSSSSAAARRAASRLPHPAELLPSDDDVKIGEVAGAPFYVNAELYTRADRPTCVLDIEPGAAEGLPLDGLDEFHFVTRASEADDAAQSA